MVDSNSNYLSYREVADLCRDEIIPSFGAWSDDEVDGDDAEDWDDDDGDFNAFSNDDGPLMEYRDHIHSVLIMNHIDSFKVQSMNKDIFIRMINIDPFEDGNISQLLKILKSKIPQITWPQFANSLFHENKSLGKLMNSVLKQQYFGDFIDEQSRNEMIEAMKTKRTLNTMEIDDIETMMEKAINGDHGFVSSPRSLLIFFVFFTNHSGYRCTYNHCDYASGFLDEDPSFHGKLKDPNLTLNLLRDIYGTHKVFIFGSFKFKNYGPKDFKKDIERQDFQKPAKKTVSEDHHIHGLSLHPMWLINDDLFQIFAVHFAVSSLVEPIDPRMVGDGLTIHSIVIPQNVVSVYDHSISFQGSFDDIECDSISIPYDTEDVALIVERMGSAFFDTISSRNVDETNIMDKIDKSLYLYYLDHGRYDYLDEEGIGKFAAFCEEVGVDENVLNEELLEGNPSESLLVDLDDNFPFNVTQIDFGKRVLEVIKKCRDHKRKELYVIVDRRTKQQKIQIVRETQIEDILSLRNNHFISLEYQIQKSQVTANNMIRTWLHFGDNQCIRFWPEQLVWFIPRLFVKKHKNEYQYLKRIYGNEYRHGFRPHLEDPLFNRYYKMITGWDHVTVNYYRSESMQQRSGIQDHFEDNLSDNPLICALMEFLDSNQFDSDAICADVADEVGALSDQEPDSNIMKHLQSPRKPNSKRTQLIMNLYEFTKSCHSLCTIENPLEKWDCQYIKEIIGNLLTFQDVGFHVEAANVSEFDFRSTIRGLDHLVTVHNLFGIENGNSIRAYVQRQIRCDLGSDCHALSHECLRRSRLFTPKQQITMNRENDNNLSATTMDCLCSAHCYLLHSDDVIYRRSGQNTKFEMNPFTISPDEKEEENKDGDRSDVDGAPLSVDWGIHVLQWLPFTVQPRFQSFLEEMLGNPASALNQEILDKVQVECAVKIEEAKRNGFTFTMNEMLCLKLYSDYTRFQREFRCAHWKGSSEEIKRQFYQWALLMHKTFLFHAAPIPTPKFGNSQSPQLLYHGLNKIFMLETSTPTFFGPLSTTTSMHTVATFSNNAGVEFTVKSSYLNPLKLVIGIKMSGISTFKHEQEILLHSQMLPISRTKAHEKRDENLIINLLSTLKNTKNKILNRNIFFRETGVVFHKEWIAKIHDFQNLLEANSVLSDHRIVAFRMYDELRIVSINRFLTDYLVRSINEQDVSMNIETFWKKIGIPQDAERRWIVQDKIPDKLLADYLMKYVLVHGNRELTDIQQIFGQFGITRLFDDSKWQSRCESLLAQNADLRIQSQDVNRLLVDVLVDDFQLIGLSALSGAFAVANRIHLQKNAICLRGRDLTDSQRGRAECCGYDLNVNGKIIGTEYRLSEIQEGMMKIPSTAHSLDESEISIQITAVLNNIRQPVTIWNIFKKHSFTAYELVDSVQTLKIQNTLKVSLCGDEFIDGGSIRIEGRGDILVMEGGVIDANGAGLSDRDECLVYTQMIQELEDLKTLHKYSFLTFGPLIDDNSITECSAADGRGGGIIFLRSFANITNLGVLSSSGMIGGHFGGGTICLSAKDIVVNHGLIESKPSGRIMIQCREFVNDGKIEPPPTVMIVNQMDEIEIRVLTMSYHDKKICLPVPDRILIELLVKTMIWREIPVDPVAEQEYFAKIFIHDIRDRIEKWVPILVENPKIWDIPDYETRKIAEILADKFDLKQLRQVIDIFGSLAAAHYVGEMIYVRKNALCLRESDLDPIQMDRASNLRFTMTINGRELQKEYNLGDLQNGKMQFSSTTNTMEDSGIDIQIYAIISALDQPIKFRNIEKRIAFPRYEIEIPEPLPIQRKLKVSLCDSEFVDGGSIQIIGRGDILLMETCVIDANGVGLIAKDMDDCRVYKQLIQNLRDLEMLHKYSFLTFGTTIDDYSNTESSTSDGRGGGIIFLYSSANITNLGVLSSNGMIGGQSNGGTICLCAKDIVANHGLIESKPSGRIIIQSREFLNDGKIEPPPTVMIVNQMDEMEIRVLTMSYHDTNICLPDHILTELLVKTMKTRKIPKGDPVAEQEYFAKILIHDIRDRFEKWLPILVENPNIWDIPDYETRTIAEILADKFDLKELRHVCAAHLIGERIYILQNTVCLPESNMDAALLRNAANFKYTITINERPSGDEYTFSDLQNGRMQISATTNTMMDIQIKIQIYAIISGFDQPIKIRNIDKQVAFPQYEIESAEPLQIQRKLKVSFCDDEIIDGGSIRIKGREDILVTESGVIDANGVGISDRDECLIYSKIIEEMGNLETLHKCLFLSFGTLIDDNSIAESSTADGRGGGIIFLRSFTNITNLGVLSSNGMIGGQFNGGTICLCAKHIVANHGLIESKPSGRIIIQCREFLNDGKIEPAPIVMIVNQMDEMEIRVVTTSYRDNNICLTDNVLTELLVITMKTRQIPIDPVAEKEYFGKIFIHDIRDRIEKWVPDLIENPNIWDIPHYDTRNIADILTDKFDLKELRDVLDRDKNVSAAHLIGERIYIRQNTLCLRESDLNAHQMERASNSKYMMIINGRKSQNEYILNDLQNGKMQFSSTTNTIEDIGIDIRIYAMIPSVHQPIKIMNVEKQIAFARYEIESLESLQIVTKFKVSSMGDKFVDGGTILIRCNTDIYITESGVIDGNGCGLRMRRDVPAFAKFVGEFILCSSKFPLTSLIKANASTAFPVSDGSGGIICLRSDSVITNDGVLCSNGLIAGNSSGGTIGICAVDGMRNYGMIECSTSMDIDGGGVVVIVTEGEFVNNGVIECGADGLVSIECSGFLNEGTISSKTNVVIGRNENIKAFIEEMSSMNEEERLMLTVMKHRGHFDEYHPQHLLKKGTGDYYDSYGCGPPNEDWIVFKYDGESRLIPITIIIRNMDQRAGIKRIAIYGGNNANDLKQWIEIDGIHKENEERQIFPIGLEQRYIAYIEQFKYFKLRVLENHGNQQENAFHEFSLLGVRSR